LALVAKRKKKSKESRVRYPETFGGTNKAAGERGSNLKSWTRFDKARQRIYLDILAKTGRKAESAMRAGVTRQTVYKTAQKDLSFAMAEEEAMQVYRESIEAEIHRRAIDGWDEPVFHRGQVQGKVRKYSDQLLAMLAKRHIAEYRDRTSVQKTVKHEGAVGVYPTLEVLKDLPPEQQAQLRHLLKQVKASREAQQLEQARTIDIENEEEDPGVERED